MNPLGTFVLAFILWLSSGFYLGPAVRRLSKRVGELVAYWTVVSIFDVLLAVFVTFLCPKVYFVHWDFSLKDFLMFFSLALLSLIPAIPEFMDFLSPKSEEEKEELELVKGLTFVQATVLQVISAALPEELVNRYVFLGLLSLWNPLAGLVGVSLFFGLTHKLSHPKRRWGTLLSNILVGFVLGWAYLYTGSLLLIMAIHWLIDMLPWVYLRYRNAGKPILGSVVLSAVLPPVLLRGELIKAVSYLGDIYSISALLWGVAVGLLMLAVVYAGFLMLKRKSGR